MTYTIIDNFGNLISVSHFGISTGDKAGYYTLRAFGTRTRYARTERGTVSKGTDDASVYIRNLSTDKEQAVLSARQYLAEHYPEARFSGVVNFDLEDIERISREEAEMRRREEEERIASTDWSVFQTGKYKGASVTTVVAEDKNYADWFSGAFSTHPEHKRTAAIIDEALRPERERVAKDRADRASVLLGLIGAEVEAWVAGERGGFCQSIARGLQLGSAPCGRGLEILLSIIAKREGRSGSKAYNARLQEISELVGA